MMLYRCFVFFLLSFAFQIVNAKTLEICANGCQYNSIQTAIDKAENGDTLFIKKGIYKEFDLTIYKKSLFITGEDGTVVDVDSKGYGFRVEATDITLKNITIKNILMSYTKEYAAVFLFKSFDFLLENINIEGAFFGIVIQKSKNGKILKNNISGEGTSEANSGNAIHLWHSEYIIIEDNKAVKMRDGIYLEFGNFCEINKNISENNMRYGLHFMFSNNNSYTSNVFNNNGAGVAVMFSKQIVMINNLFKNNWGPSSYGLLLKEINDAEIKHNRFENNTIGINADGTNRINFTENNFLNNGYAVKVLGACYTNTYTRNNFLYNTFNLSYSGNLNSNKFVENYWSDYSGYDLDKDGIGDVPYRPVKLYSYLVNKTPEAIVLLRSLFIDIVDFSEKVSPVFTPENLTDDKPLIKKITW